MLQRTTLKRMERTCLKCNHNFPASGRYNRLCCRCKTRRARGAYDEHRVIFPWT